MISQYALIIIQSLTHSLKSKVNDVSLLFTIPTAGTSLTLPWGFAQLGGNSLFLLFSPSLGRVGKFGLLLMPYQFFLIWNRGLLASKVIIITLFFRWLSFSWHLFVFLVVFAFFPVQIVSFKSLSWIFLKIVGVFKILILFISFSGGIFLGCNYFWPIHSGLNLWFWQVFVQESASLSVLFDHFDK